MPYTSEMIRRSLDHRVAGMSGQSQMELALRNLATDLIGTTDPADLPADCRAWVERAVDDAASTVARATIEQLLAELATRLAAAPDDLGHCELMQAVARAQSIHVTEVR